MLIYHNLMQFFGCFNSLSISDAEVEVPIVGNVKLDEDELSVLKLPPDFAILDKLTEEEFCLETEMSMTKLRWEKRKQMEDNVEGEVVTKEVEEEREKNEEEEAKTRQIYNPVEKILDLRKRRVTDMKENSKVYLPKPLPVIEEANIAIRRDKYEQTFKDFVEEKCSKKAGLLWRTWRATWPWAPCTPRRTPESEMTRSGGSSGSTTATWRSGSG